MQVLYIYIYIYIFNMCMVQSESIYMHIRSTFTNNKIQIYNAFDADCMPVCAVYVRVCPHTHNMRTRIHIHTHTRTHTHIIHTVRVYKNESWAHTSESIGVYCVRVCVRYVYVWYAYLCMCVYVHVYVRGCGHTT